jgi:hypothetical protein
MLMHSFKLRLHKRTSSLIGIRSSNHFPEDLPLANTSIEIFITGADEGLFLEVFYLMLLLDMTFLDTEWAYFILFAVFAVEFVLVD